MRRMPVGVLVTLIVLTSACAATDSGTTTPSSNAVSAMTVTATPYATATPRTTSTRRTTETPRTTAPSATGTSRRSCTGPAAIRAETGAQPQPVCLQVGATVAVTAESSSLQPWRPLESSASAVVRCDTHPAASGTIAGTCTAVGPGTATLTTITSPYAGDPGGPPQYRWQLRVTVVG